MTEKEVSQGTSGTVAADASQTPLEQAMANAVLDTIAHEEKIEKAPTPKHEYAVNCLGETIGTCIMVFFGVGAVCNATISGNFTGPMQVGIVWAFAIAIAIYATRNLSDAHFNPAVTLAMVVTGRMPARKLGVYLLGQAVGAFVGAGMLLLFFGMSVEFAPEAAIVDGGALISAGDPGSYSSVWAEVFPNNGNLNIPWYVACLAEGVGTFCLVFVIFCLTDGSNVGRPNTNLAPILIGLTVFVIICVVGPMTNAGLNPARDFMPRIVALIAGWNLSVAIPPLSLLVYIVSPIIGGICAGLYFTIVVEKRHYWMRAFD